MPNQHRFPPADDEFSTQVNIAVPYLILEAVRLLISAGHLTDLPLKLGDWNNWFPKSQDPNQRTTTITDNKNDARNLLEDLLGDIYDDIPDSVLTNDDRNTLRIPKRKPASERPAIKDTPFTDVTSEAGALIESQSRTHKDSTRPSRHTDADALEMVYLIDKEKIPASPDDCNKSFVSRKARIKLQLNVADAGKNFSGFWRWVNLSDASKNGPWSLVITVIIQK